MTGRGLIVAAPRSGSGKTVITLALLAALKRRGIAVRAAKAGPDYIDPGFHAAATGTPGCNLDSWAMSPDLLDRLLAEAATGAEILVIEGVMGLFDGVAGSPGRCGTTADLAARFHLPVLLVLDVAGQSQSAAAVLRGFATHTICRAHCRRDSQPHRQRTTPGLGGRCDRVLGHDDSSAPSRDVSLALPERHLGLVQAGGTTIAAWLDRLAALAERHLNLGAVWLAQLHRLSRLLGMRGLRYGGLPPPGQCIALASDQAFTFVTRILDGWRRRGDRDLYSLADEPPPDHCDAAGCRADIGTACRRAGGGSSFRAGLAHFAQNRPIHGECSGYGAGPRAGRCMERATP